MSPTPHMITLLENTLKRACSSFRANEIPALQGRAAPQEGGVPSGGRLVWAPMPQRGLWGHDPTNSRATSGLQKRERTSNSNNKQINKQTQRTKASVFPRPMTSNKHLFTRVSNTVK